MSRKELISAIHRGQVLIITGAGVSIDASGNRPSASWIGLLRASLIKLDALKPEDEWVRNEMKRLSQSGTDALHLTYLADQVRERMLLYSGNDTAFDKWLSVTVAEIDEGYKDPTAPKALINGLIALGGRLATTNYDHILELCARAKTVTMDQVRDVSAFIRSDLNAVLHFHGVPEKPLSIVLGRQSYKDYVSTKLTMEFQRALSTVYSCLFIGFGQGMEDLNFSPWFTWIKETLANSEIRHYVLLNDTQAGRWNTTNHGPIEALAYGHEYSQLPPYLEQLKADANRLGKSAEQGNDSSISGMEPLLLDEKIIARVHGKEAIAKAIHQFIVMRFQETGLHYYAAKYRIKSYQSIWHKVHDLKKRNPESNIINLVDSVRDIIGIRIVTLYRLDLLNVVRQVAGWFSSADADAPFRAALQEVKVFGSDGALDSQHNPYGIVSSLTLHFEEIGVKVTANTKQLGTSYSAFHLLCSYIGIDASIDNFEIQIRSALEDIWSEIEHPLRYKPIEVDANHALKEMTDLQLARYHLLSLKSLIDGAAQYADNIRTQIEWITSIDVRQLPTYTLNKTDRLRALLGPSRTANQFHARFAALFLQQTKIIASVLDPNEPLHKKGDRSNEPIVLLRLAKEFEDLLVESKDVSIKRGSDRKEVELIIRMEQALCLLEGAARNPNRHEEVQLLKSALQIYTVIANEIGAHDNSSWHANYRHIVFYRLARVYYRLEFVDASIEACERAYVSACGSTGVDRLDRDGNKIRVSIAQYLIFLLQDKAEDLSITSENLNDSNYRLSERRELYRRMAQVSLEGIEKLHGRNEDFCNTALFAAAEHAALGSQVWENKIGTPEKFDALWVAFRKQGDVSTNSDKIHTCFRVAEYIREDLDFAAEEAKRLIEVIEREPNPDKYQLRDLRQARAWLLNRQKSTAG